MGTFPSVGSASGSDPDAVDMLGQTPRSRRSRLTRWGTLGTIWLLAFLFSIASYHLYNDHFDRISRARQIARYGELPFRDFFDPGYFLAEFSSAGLQLLLGDNLLGDLLLDCAFLATGVTIVVALAWRLSQSIVWALAAGTMLLLTLPRPYDFDKSLFYPLGIALCWHYVGAPTRARIWLLALGTVIAALYRYDTGLYITAAAIVVMAVRRAGHAEALWRDLVTLTTAVACLSVPALIFLQATSGLLNVADQVASYARREAARTRVTAPPRLSIAQIVGWQRLPQRTIAIRWAASVDEPARRSAEGSYGLSEGTLHGAPEDRTWSYSIQDVSRPALDRLLHDPRVDDTSGIDRGRLELTSEARWIRAQRAVPLLRLRLFPGSWQGDNADAFLYYLMRLLPLAGALVLVFGVQSSGIPRDEAARVAGLIVLCLILNALILREPVAARIGGMAGPAVLLSVWLLARIRNLRTAARRAMLKTVAVLCLLVTMWSISASARWPEHLSGDFARPSHLADVFRTMSSSPPDLALVEGRPLRGLVSYLRECTGPRDRILATWFVPEVYFFAQRGFAAGLPVMFGGHWSEPRFARQGTQRLDAQPPIVVITPGAGVGGDDPWLSVYLAEHYRLAGAADFSGEGSSNVVRLFIRNDAAPASIHPATGMPCFSYPPTPPTL